MLFFQKKMLKYEKDEFLSHASLSGHVDHIEFE